MQITSFGFLLFVAAVLAAYYLIPQKGQWMLLLAVSYCFYLLAGIEYLQTIAFILVIAALVQLVEMVLKRFMPALYSALGVYLPLITTNCAVLGVAILNIQTYGVASGESLLQAFLNGVFSGVGFTLAILLLAGIREKMDVDMVPKPFRGFPITLIAASIMAMAFAAFGGMIS